MTDLTGRLQRRAAGGGAPMLPYLADRPADPRFGPAAPWADLGVDPVGDPFAEPAVFAEPSPAEFASPVREAMPAAAPVVVERRSERVVERTRELAEPRPTVVAAPTLRPQSPVPRDSGEALAPPAPIVTSTTVVQHVEPAPARVPATSPSTPVVQPVSRDIPSVTPLEPPSRLVRRIAAEPLAERVAETRPANAIEPRVEARPLAQPEPLAQPLSPLPSARPVARLEPRPREPQAQVVAAPEPEGPRVVIGNLHIEVVRSPAPATPRREPAKREAPRAAASAAPKPGIRRRTVFGLGQL